MKPEDAAKNIAANVRRLRRAKGWTQVEAGEKLRAAGGPNWSKAMWSMVERTVDGRKMRAFTAEEVVHLASLFGVPIAELFDEPPMVPCPQCDGTGLVVEGES